jgi:hypothetical protein
VQGLTSGRVQWARRVVTQIQGKSKGLVSFLSWRPLFLVSVLCSSSLARYVSFLDTLLTSLDLVVTHTLFTLNEYTKTFDYKADAHTTLHDYDA